MDGSPRDNLRWLVNALRPTPNPLRRWTDRAAATIMVVLLAAALLGVPVAVWFGIGVHARETAEAATAAASTRSVAAVVMKPPEARYSGENREIQTLTWWSDVQWRGLYGLPHTDTVRVQPSTEVGSTVPVWVDSAEHVTQPPDSNAKVMAGAVTSAVFALVAWQALCAALIFVTRVATDALAERAWHREWEIVEPKWTHFRR